MSKPIRILSLDGGGTWALIQARTLGKIYGDNTSGSAILGHFDWAFANSGGSIVLAGLMIGKTPAEIVGQFGNEQLRRRMFTRKSWLNPLNWAAHILDFGPRYKTKPKYEVLHELVGDVPLKSVLHTGGARPRTDIVIVGFDYDRERAFFFRPPDAPRGPRSHCLLAQAVHASSTAPVNFFDEPAEFNIRVDDEQEKYKRFWDGGVTGLNNPAAAAVAEAIALGKRASEIAVLSIGTGTVALPDQPDHPTASPDYVVSRKRSTLVRDLVKLATSVIGDPPDFASFLAHTMLGGTAPTDQNAGPSATDVIRLNPLLCPEWRGGRWDYPSGFDQRDEFDTLLNLGLDALKPEEMDLIAKLTDLWMADATPNQPVRFRFRPNPLPGLQAQVGHDRFSDALAAWQTLGP